MINRSAFLTAAGAAALMAAAPATAYAADAARSTVDDLLVAGERHKQVFASIGLGGGAVLKFMRNSIIGFRDGMHEGPGTLKAVGVLYGSSITLVAGADVWRRFDLPEFLRGTGERVPKGDGNPFAVQVAELAAQQACFLVCNNALKGLSSAIADSPPWLGRVSSEEVRSAILGSLPPGVGLVPAGVTALALLQEAHYTLIQATL